MRHALALAEHGRGRVHPNPLVGAVLVFEGRIVAEGWHTRCGNPHAEIEVIAAARAAGFSRWNEATLYVTLEPCCHQGRTPPCTEAVITAGIRHVVYSLDDPDPRVDGGGRSRLESAGVTVEKGVLNEEAAAQNEAYLRHRRTGLPFVTWKTVRTPDGATSWIPGTRTAISCPEADAWVDELRGRHDAVLVGGRTARIDNPGLRVRRRDQDRDALDPVRRSAPDPWRIVVTSSGLIPPSSRLLTENADKRTMILTCKTSVSRHACSFGRADAAMDALAGECVEVLGVTRNNAGLDLCEALRLVADRGLLAVLCEAGDTLGRALLAADLLQRLVVIEAPETAAPPGWTTTMTPTGTPAHADLIARPGRRREDWLGRDRRIIVDLAPAISPKGTSADAAA